MSVLLVILSLIFAMLKLAGVITVSWWIVALPVLILAFCYVVVVAAVVLIAKLSE